MAYYKRQLTRNIAKCHEISLAKLPSATKFRSKYRSVQRNIIVAQTIGLPKYRRNIAPNESSLIFVKYSRNLPNFVCITFAQYCTWRNPCLKEKIRAISDRCLKQRTCCVTIYSFPADESLISASAIKRHIFHDNELKLL